MSILVRILILILIIFLGGFCSGMLAGLHMNDKYKAKHMKTSKKDIKLFEGAIEHERVVAIKEKKSADYIDGMTRIINLFRKLFKEELEEKI